MPYKNRKSLAILYAILAALLYGLSSPISKMLLMEVSPTMMAALLYLGAGLGMLLVNMLKRVVSSPSVEASITKKELPFIVAMIILDIAAPILLMAGLIMTNASTASLLNNFEIVATTMIAMLIFKESIGKRMWLAIGLIVLSSFVLSISDVKSFSFSLGAMLILLACVCWGFENNCTRSLSLKDPLQIVVIKGLGSGIGALIIAVVLGESWAKGIYVILTLLLGFVAYGMSIFLYIKAQRDLGAARTSAFYASAPFIGVLLSWAILSEPITLQFVVALFIMIVGTYFAVSEEHSHRHSHVEAKHDHKHSHSDGHHDHEHDPPVEGEHAHEHTHLPLVHEHPHLQDVHHRHMH